MINLNGEEKQWIDDIWKKLNEKLSKTATEVRNFIPYRTENGKYIPDSNEGITWWTNGFYGGMMWLMYNATKNEEYRKTAEIQEKLLDEALRKYDGLHHDVGFMWGLTAKANYILNNNKESRVRALYAANLLAGRVNIRGGFIRAWYLKPAYSIIDSMLNIPILYWASRELNDDRFRYIAEMHADMTMRDHIRGDGSVVHIAVHAEEHDEVTETLGGQGYAVGSAWTRGQAWAIYGFILSYIYTGKSEYIETAKKVSDYFLECAEKNDFKIVTDFKAPAQPLYYDNTAAVCASCGMIEIYKATGEEKYLKGSINILKSLEEDCIFDDSNQSVLQNCMTSYSNGKQTDLIYGDFFLVEAILKLKGSEYLIW